MKYQGKTFRNETVELDGNDYDGCTFENCQFVYRASGTTKIENCSFFGFNLTFEDAAANAVTFLSALYQGGFTSLIEQIFNNIRTGNVPLRKETSH